MEQAPRVRYADLVGLALRPVHPVYIARAWRHFVGAFGEERLHDSADVGNIFFLEVMVRREIKPTITKAFSLFELNVIGLSTLEEVHGLQMKREEIISRFNLMLSQKVPDVVLFPKAAAHDTDNPRFILLSFLHHRQWSAC